MKRINKFEGLYGQTGRESLGVPIYSELLETRSHTFDWIILPHIHPRRFQIFFVSSGEFEYQEAGRQRKVQSPCLIVIPPAVLHGFVFNAEAKGRILSLSDSLVAGLFPDNELLVPMLNSAICIASFSKFYPAEKIEADLEDIDGELFNDEKEKDLMLRLRLQQLFLVIYRSWLENQELMPQGDNISLRYFRKFQQLIRDKEGRGGVTELAAEVGVSAVHLNRICKQVAGKSAGELIQEYLLEEARKYLTYTSYTISEIAYLLGFEYPNYFARFFKKLSGMSPSMYRDNQGQGE